MHSKVFLLRKKVKFISHLKNEISVIWVAFGTTHKPRTELLKSKQQQVAYLIMLSRQFWSNDDGRHHVLLASNFWYKYVTREQTDLQH